MVEECGSFSEQVLQTSSSRRERQEGDVITVTEVTQSLRRVSQSSAPPLTQRVTLTKTVRKRLDGTVLEEDEDEVIEDVEDVAAEETSSGCALAATCKSEAAYADSLNGDEGNFIIN